MKISLRERIASKIQIKGECHIWTGAKNNEQPRVWRDGRFRYVKFEILELLGKEVPERYIFNSCGNSLCVNYEHFIIKGQEIWRRFLGRILITEQGCWDWTGGKNKAGYGALRVESEQVLAHRISYALYKGEIPEGMNVCHSCDRPCCVNPDHLFLGTDKENSQDMVKKGRSLHGEKCLQAKLKRQQVSEIRASDEGAFSLSRKYGVGPGQIWRIRKGHCWKKQYGY